MKSQDLKKKKNKLPSTPGVYFFLGRKIKEGGARPVRDRSPSGDGGRASKETRKLFASKSNGMGGRRVLYIGKAGSLRDRVRSYFTKDLGTTRSSAIAAMVDCAERISFQETGSVLEALILESVLIKKYKPKYNVREKDDKSFNYIVITDEDFPRVLVVRQREILLKKFKSKAKYMFGPFPQAGVLREALSIVRKIFAFRDKCTPLEEQKKKDKVRPCFNRQIGLCPGVCTGEASKKEYKKIIQNISLFFEGKKGVLVNKLKREMIRFAKKQEFERAGKLKKTIFALEHIHDISLIKSDIRRSYESSSFYIEGYDVAHTSGTHTVGVMTVVEGGEAKKSAYRKFIVRKAKLRDDAGALREIIERRLGHGEWRLPDLFVADGGKIQKQVIERALKEARVSIPVVSVVKDEHHRPREIYGLKKYREKYEKEILLVNHEAHRFAINWHRKKMRNL